MRLGHHRQRDRRALHRPQQPDAAFDLAVVEHQARSGNLHGRAAGLRVHQEHGAGIVVGAAQRFGKREWPIALAAADGEDLRLGTGLGMDIERAPFGHHQAFRREGLDANVIGSRGDRAFDPGTEQILEHAEQRVLQCDGQCEEPIEEGGDRRQLFAQGTVLVGEAQPRGVLERLQRAAFDLAGEQQTIKLAQRGAAVDGFEIVVGAEQALPASLTLALGDRAKRVEPAGDGREEALLGLHIGGDRPEQGRLRLIGAIAAAQALDRGVGLPARLQ